VHCARPGRSRNRLVCVEAPARRRLARSIAPDMA
jgi:hypothetical protein